MGAQKLDVTRRKGWPRVLLSLPDGVANDLGGWSCLLSTLCVPQEGTDVPGAQQWHLPSG